MQDVGRLLHLHHEGRLPARDVIRRADPGEQAIDDRQLRAPRRNERARLGHEAEQRALSQVGGLAAHVGAGQDDQLLARRVERDVVGHERVGHVPLDDRMARVDGDQLVAVVDERLGVVVDGGRLGERRQHVQRGEAARRVLDARRLGPHAPPQRVEDLHFALDDPLIRAEHLLFVLLQRGGDEALPAGDGLLAVVIGRHVGEVRLRDLDVIAEHPVVADLEVADAGARPLRFLHLGDALLAAAADAAQLVELRVDAVAHHAAVARDPRRLVDQRLVEGLAHVHEIVQLGDETLDQRRLELLEPHSHARYGGDRLAQRDEIPRAGRAQRRARDQAVDVVHRLQRLAQLDPGCAAEREILDRIEPILDPLERHEWPQQPAAQQASAHRRDRAVDFMQQRAGAAAVLRLDHLQVSQRDRIHEETIGAGAERDVPHVREVRLLRVAQVLHQRAGGGDGGRPVVEAEPLERLRLQLAEQGAPRRLVLERPRLGPRQAGLETRRGQERGRILESFRSEHLARPQHAELVAQRRPAVRSEVLGGRELAGREIEEGHAEPGSGMHRGEREQERRFARVQVSGVGQRAG